MDITIADAWPDLINHIGATRFLQQDLIQSLWSGYGSIVRITTDSSTFPTLIVKHIQVPETQSHPRGWQGEASNLRKLMSYQVEAYWYEHYASQCAIHCAMPDPVFRHHSADSRLIAMTDLDDRFPDRYTSLPVDFVACCLAWLARFHAHHLGNPAEGLWPLGCYWHLGTRQDEYAAMHSGPLKQAASALDDALANCHYQTIVHGDAKVANFCFDSVTPAVAAVDFQYVGKGCGMKDVAYFLGSCLTAEQCFEYESELLNSYFNEMVRYLPAATLQPLEREWRTMYPLAWADFHRFLEGWMPEHAKIDPYMKQQTQFALDYLGVSQWHPGG